ncbi:MAG: endolytic transglycosylase MltG [Muribaculaceae bacterium]|nr:endolytic transglycosylase MltG [Muribaculaceae bacterium]
MQTRDNRKGSRTKYWILGTVGGLLLAVCIVLIPLLTVTSAQSATIRIPRGADGKVLTDTLTKYFGEDYARTVMRVMTEDQKKLSLRFGAYDIPEGTSALKATYILSRGAESPFNLVINGVRDLDSFLPRIATRFYFPEDSLRSALARPEVMQRYGLTDTRQLPAIFLNDTYTFYWSASPDKVIEKIASNYENFWTPARRQRAQELGMTPLEISIIASIVDEETNQQSEKGRVGRLYINRLHKGMKLQADPTVRYAVGDFTIKRVTGKHLSVDSPYNTYRVKGLPPGPIRTTSKATLQAILDSEPSDDLYMCAKEDFSGSHNFASDYESHLANARRYQAALDSLGIKGN